MTIKEGIKRILLWLKKINDKIDGGGEDSFPYEYYCPDDFSVVINPEDWNVVEGAYLAEILIPTQIQIPENYKLKSGSCNDSNYDSNEEVFIISIGSGKSAYTGEVSINLERNKIYIIIYDEVDLSKIGIVTLNFKDLIFLGNKK